jgi:hypothetical protein
MSGTTVFIDQNGVFGVHKLSSVVTISPRQANSKWRSQFWLQAALQAVSACKHRMLVCRSSIKSLISSAGAMVAII